MLGLTVYHHISRTDWSISSYKRIAYLDTPEKFWRFINNLPVVYNGMIAIMVEDIAPVWEDPKNSAGGTCTTMLNNRTYHRTIEDILARLVTGELTDTSISFTGVTISRKRNDWALKLWSAAPVDKNVVFKSMITAASYAPHH